MINIYREATCADSKDLMELEDLNYFSPSTQMSLSDVSGSHYFL
jgi:hypothetical protein